MTMFIHPMTAPFTVDAGGTIRIRDTGVRLISLLQQIREGLSVAEILENHELLTPADVYKTMAYDLEHKDEMDEFVRQYEEDSERGRREIESQPAYQARRARMRALYAERHPD